MADHRIVTPICRHGHPRGREPSWPPTWSSRPDADTMGPAPSLPLVTPSLQCGPVCTRHTSVRCPNTIPWTVGGYLYQSSKKITPNVHFSLHWRASVSALQLNNTFIPFHHFETEVSKKMILCLCQSFCCFLVQWITSFSSLKKIIGTTIVHVYFYWKHFFKIKDRILEDIVLSSRLDDFDDFDYDFQTVWHWMQW
jgi:hypothetical protein